METRWSWIQLLHSIVASSEIRNTYGVIERGKKIWVTQDVVLVV